MLLCEIHSSYFIILLLRSKGWKTHASLCSAHDLLNLILLVLDRKPKWMPPNEISLDSSCGFYSREIEREDAVTSCKMFSSAKTGKESELATGIPSEPEVTLGGIRSLVTVLENSISKRWNSSSGSFAVATVLHFTKCSFTFTVCYSTRPRFRHTHIHTHTCTRTAFIRGLSTDRRL